MRISDWSSDVCSSDLPELVLGAHAGDILGTDRVPATVLVANESASQRHVFLIAHVSILRLEEIGSAACRERVCPYVLFSVVAVSSTKKKNSNTLSNIFTYYF